MCKARAELQKALYEYYENYPFCNVLPNAAEEVLKTRVSNYRGKKTTVISKIAREENFNAEEVAALRAGIEKFDVETVITAIKNRDYEFHPDVEDSGDLGDVLREQLVDDGIIPKWIMNYVDREKLGLDHILNVANEYVFSVYGYFELF